MAFDQPNNSAAAGQNQTTTSSGNSDDLSQKKVSSSPWDEELPEETPKDQKIGGFSGPATTQKTAVTEEPSFVVPQNIENQTALNIVDNNNLITHDSDLGTEIPASDVLSGSVRNGAMDLDIPGAQLPATEVSNNQVMPSSSSAINSSVPSPLVPTQTIPAANEADDLDIFDSSFSSQKAISTDIKSTSAVPAQVVQPAPIPTSSVVPVSTQTVSAEPIGSNIATPNPAPINTAPMTQQIPAAPSLPPQSQLPTLSSQLQQADSSTNVASPIQSETKKNNLFASLFKRKGAAPIQGSQPTMPVQPSQGVPAPMSDQILGPETVNKHLPLPLIIGGGILSLVFIGILLTESGIASIGFEKIYNPLGLEILWGGLPKDAEKAFGQTLSAMKTKNGFKVTGDVRLNIDKTLQSPISTPLVSFIGDNKALVYIKPEKAVLTVTEEDWVVVDPDSDPTAANDPISSDSQTDSSTTSDSTDLEGNAGETTTSSGDTSTSSTSDSNSGTDQQLDGSYEGVQSSSKELLATVEGSVGQNGNSLKFLIDKAGTSEVDLKNSLGKLWVKSDKIKFSGSAEDDKWLEYNLPGLEEKDVFKEFWAGDWSQSSVKGKKIGNEKIGKARCYKYQIEDLEIGAALSGIGITSDSVQKITGNVWIGIKDKLIRKIDLKITPPTSSSITAIELSLKFDNFGQAESLSKPDSLEVITDPAPFSTSENTSTIDGDASTTGSQSTESETAAKAAADKAAADALVAKNDEQRKSDLVTVKNALESYRSKYGKYPLSTMSINLGLEPNVISSALVPSYIAALPKDPKNLEGWFYAYKSLDGKTYYLSTRLENPLDPGLKAIDNISLYFLYNN